MKSLTQNNVKIEKNQHHTNFSIDGGVGKYAIIAVLLCVFFYFLLKDLETLKRDKTRVLVQA